MPLCCLSIYLAFVIVGQSFVSGFLLEPKNPSLKMELLVGEEEEEEEEEEKIYEREF